MATNKIVSDRKYVVGERGTDKLNVAVSPYFMYKFCFVLKHFVMNGNNGNKTFLR